MLNIDSFLIVLFPRNFVILFKSVSMEDVYTPNSLGEEFPNTQECSQSSSQNGRSVTQSQWWLVSMNSNVVII